MKDLATLLLKSLSSTPDKVVVTETVEENRVYLSTKVDGADKGRVIGKDGCIIKAVRTVLTAAAANQDKKVTLKLEDE
ncbi:MAG: KH domain-containing protein [Elusimicrobiaceae bacterium]|nr:KH domain-containing protein [Elusimicrobiaceae bacterium]MBP5617015.1 KH domain-containing protein [Elusimicrobiaceae bacterium]